MTHSGSHIIVTQRVINATKTAFTGDTKFVSLAVALASAIAGGWFF